MPFDAKVRDGRGKWLLRQVLDRYVPKSIVDRPKMGFGVPVDRWVRGPLREWAEDLLDAGKMREEGILDPARVRRLWEEHLSGNSSHSAGLWNLLMFQAWRRRWG